MSPPLVPIQKLLRTPLTALGERCYSWAAPRLLRSPITAIGVPRYVSGWELKDIRELVSRIGSGLLVCGLLLHSGCLQDEVRALRRNEQEILRQLAEVKADQQQLVARVENEARAMWTQQLCKSGKIAEFVSEVQAGIPGVCSAGSLETALIFLNNLPYATAIFRTGLSNIVLPLSREGQLRDLLDPHNLHPSTRLLILVQPSDESEAAQSEALTTGTKYLSVMRSLVPTQSKLRLLGPFLLPCRLRGEVSRRYQGPMDSPVPGEPADKIKRIRVWAFRTDC